MGKVPSTHKQSPEFPVTALQPVARTRGLQKTDSTTSSRFSLSSLSTDMQYCGNNGINVTFNFWNIFWCIGYILHMDKASSLFYTLSMLQHESLHQLFRPTLCSYHGPDPDPDSDPDPNPNHDHDHDAGPGNFPDPYLNSVLNPDLDLDLDTDLDSDLNIDLNPDQYLDWDPDLYLDRDPDLYLDRDPDQYLDRDPDLNPDI